MTVKLGLRITEKIMILTKKGFETVITKQEKAYLSFRGLSYVAAAQEKWEEAGKNL